MAKPCKESASGQHGTSDRNGKCLLCGVKIWTALPKPDRLSAPTEQDTEYRRTYDPDFGERRDDV